MVGRFVLVALALLVASQAGAAVPLCDTAPRSDCRLPVVAGEGGLLLKDGATDRGNRLLWKWRKGAATSLDDFGGPTTNVDYSLCMFDGAGDRVARASAPAGGACDGGSCWRPRGGTGLVYRSAAGEPDGLTRLTLAAGDAGSAKITVKGGGQYLAVPDLTSLTLPLRVQLQAANDGPCWEAVYPAQGIVRRSVTQLKARDAAVLPAGGPAGRVHFLRVAASTFDKYTTNPTPAQQQWMRDRYWRMLVYSPYFDARVGWFPDAWVYKDLYAIYPESTVPTQHPEWILHDAGGAKLFIPYRCANGTCPQYAADPGNPAFRAQWIAEARTVLARGYRGIYVDDVNLTVSRVSDGSGNAVVPVDPRTGRAMTDADWRRYMAEFTEAIRTAFPQAEIVHNALWFLGHDDPSIQRELLSADWINFERGVNDTGIRGGTGTYGIETFLAHVDWLHGHARHVVLDAEATGAAAREYGLAAYFLLSTGADGLGNDQGGRPDDWWTGYDVSLGDPLGDRYAWQGVLRRDFQDGIVLLNEPGASTVTVALGASYLDLGGQPQTSVTLGSAAGAVLRRPVQSPTPPQVLPVPG